MRIDPDKLVLRPGQKHQLQLLADYTDGSRRDVTRLGVFTANNDQFADVDEDGLVTASDAGETAIVARFERTFAATGVDRARARPPAFSADARAAATTSSTSTSSRSSTA